MMTTIIANVFTVPQGESARQAGTRRQTCIQNLVPDKNEAYTDEFVRIPGLCHRQIWL